MFRIQVAVIGTLAVFGGTCGAVHGLLQFAAFGAVALGWIMVLAAVATGMVAAVYVRRETTLVHCTKATVPMAGGSDIAVTGETSPFHQLDCADVRFRVVGVTAF